jgi:hypothetical protein
MESLDELLVRYILSCSLTMQLVHTTTAPESVLGTVT